jgi:hypothetical protein
MSDRLTLTRAFETTGIKSGDAERIATEIFTTRSTTTSPPRPILRLPCAI